MTHIIFVCHGNICRSPMAEFVLKDLAARAGMGASFLIESAAMTAEEIGNDMYPPVRRLLREKGIPFTPRRARRFTESDYDRADLVIAMDGENLRHLRRLLGADRDSKIYLLLEYAGERRDVADPWFTDDYETTYRDVRRGCEGLLAALKKQ